MKRIILPALLALFLFPLPSEAMNSTEATALVQNWYQRFLGRPADPGAATWVAALVNGQSPEAILSEILGSPEYYIRAGSSAPAFVRRLYLDLTGHVPGPQVTTFWVQRVFQSDRQDVAYDMLRRFPQTWSSPSNLYPGEGEYPFRRPYYRDIPYTPPGSLYP